MLQCPDALAPSGEKLLGIAYKEGVLPPTEQAHVDRCPVCQAALAEYIQMNDSLLARLCRSRCPDGIRLSYYCLNMVPPEERTGIASHLLTCPACADEVAQIRQQQRVFNPFPEASFSLGETIRQIFATLVVQQAMPVRRGEPQPGAWPRQYQAGSLDLSLHISRQARGEMMLLGILTSSDPAQTIETLEGLAVELYPSQQYPANRSTAQPLLTSWIDDVGNLLLEPIAAGEYTLIIRLPDKEVVIEDIKIEHG